MNTANTRLFNVGLRGARDKLVGGDSGRYERETFVEEVLLAPSERAVLDVLFDTAGEVRLEHRTPDRVYDLGAFTVRPVRLCDRGRGRPGRSRRCASTPSSAPSARRLAPDLEPGTGQGARLREPHAASVRRRRGGGSLLFACPMHPEVTADGAGDAARSAA